MNKNFKKKNLSHNLKKNKKSLKFIFLVAMAIFFLVGFAASGSALAGVGFRTFNTYINFRNFWLETTTSLDGFEDALNNYNQLVITNGTGWVRADIALFVAGISLLAIFAIGLSLFIWYLLRRKKKLNNLEPKL